MPFGKSTAIWSFTFYLFADLYHPLPSLPWWIPRRSCPGATYRESISLGAVPHSAEAGITFASTWFSNSFHLFCGCVLFVFPLAFALFLFLFLWSKEVWQILLKLAVQWLATAYHPLKRHSSKDNPHRFSNCCNASGLAEESCMCTWQKFFWMPAQGSTVVPTLLIPDVTGLLRGFYFSSLIIYFPAVLGSEQRKCQATEATVSTFVPSSQLLSRSKMCLAGWGGWPWQQPLGKWRRGQTREDLRRQNMVEWSEWSEWPMPDLISTAFNGARCTRCDSARKSRWEGLA